MRNWLIGAGLLALAVAVLVALGVGTGGSDSGGGEGPTPSGRAVRARVVRVVDGDTIVASVKTKLDAQVSAGKLTSAQETSFLATLQTTVTKFVNG